MIHSTPTESHANRFAVTASADAAMPRPLNLFYPHWGVALIFLPLLYSPRLYATLLATVATMTWWLLLRATLK
jgi:energy-converting hydrogenase Eha subunit E